jgi:hypothetical protein
MIKKIGAVAAVWVLWLGFASMPAQAQEVVKSQTFFFSSTCTGTDQVTLRSFNPTFTGKVIGGDILVFQNPTGGINYAFAGIAGGTNIILWAGLGQTHVTASIGFPGFDNSTATGFAPGGFAVAPATQIVFDLSCNSGPWQVFLTIWYV